MNPFDYLTERQYSWARRHGISIDEAGWVGQLNDNLFLPLAGEAIADFTPAQLDDLRAAHSSAALVVNVFDYWRLYPHLHLQPIIFSLCRELVGYEVQDIRFEAAVPIAWPDGLPPGHHPQPDVLIRYKQKNQPDTPKAIAIESKFREP